ncbi:MAG: dihydroneopterin aldolase [Candidatus Eremiobacteraeota bacterium]|nr:dihydroneopterin aldolase [Candidatus Eremiobacteraeota bacterium]
MNLDIIVLRDVRAYGKHGANAGERDYAQPFDLDLELEVDLSAARASDRLDDTIDYAALHERIVALVRDRSYVLLERLGDEIVADVMRDVRVRAAAVTIAKPKLLAGATPAVRISARR